jgi:hypothetical protein
MKTKRYGFQKVFTIARSRLGFFFFSSDIFNSFLQFLQLIKMNNQSYFSLRANNNVTLNANIWAFGLRKAATSVIKPDGWMDGWMDGWLDG